MTLSLSQWRWGIDKNAAEWWQSFYIPGTVKAPFNRVVDPLVLVFNYFLPALPNDEKQLAAYCESRESVRFADELVSPYMDNFHACELIDSLICLLFMSVALAFCYPLVRFLCALVSSRFNKLSYERQLYVVNNMTKSFMLGLITVSVHWWTWSYKIFVEHDYHPDGAPLMPFHLKRAVAWYCVSDLVSLVVVPRLPATTWIHHLLSVGFSVVVFAIEAQPQDVISMMGLYGSFSAFAYAVNAFLGLRVVFPKSALVDAFAIVSLLLYLACCVANWSWHTYWFAMLAVHNRITMLACIYAAGIVFIARDDLILMRWLWRRARLGVTTLLDKSTELAIAASSESPGFGCKAKPSTD
jgi:hypothetical protein